MNGSARSGMGWGARLLVGFVLILVGAGVAVWGLAHYRPAARVLGITATEPQPASPSMRTVLSAPAAAPQAPPAPGAVEAKIESLEQRLSGVENATHRAEGSAGRADALVVAFAARRAVDRGVALGYLENLLAERFGAQHQAAVATVITASRQPVRLNELIDEYETLGPQLRSGGPQDSWWDNFRREVGSLIEIHRADRPAVNAEARYNRALQQLSSGDVDQALAETMRLPGAARAGDWATKARRYIAAHRALDEIESAALLPAAGGS
jgi:hypothetical protein